MRKLTALAAVGVIAVAAGCGSSSGTNASSPSSKAAGHGTVKVLYAGSLVDLMTKGLGPGFTTATGDKAAGFSAGSKDLAADIKGKVKVADVFISASPTVNKSLEGSANGNWVSWYATFASSGLVIGYNPNSKFANDLKTKPWYEVITEKGFKLGRTDPATDPKGVLAEQALTTAQSGNHLPSNFASSVEKSATVFPEETLVGRLQAGQLDAGFFYTAESAPAKIPTISLSPIDLKAVYTVTVVNKAPDEAAAAAFIKYMLGASGKQTLTTYGLTTQTPTVSGSASAVPAGLQSTLEG
jgi:molybdate/tungstate transport system substrate-binding protein